ncbi:hypothetical protein L228DRAFT_240036 [Xylona heveae TC161]|uniref:HECT-type E3 ubiquitin transferase n=1 Tax=Xylona heveae (strain CBS 132557 / TC161) TaxID=1328760 RepID=A0A165FMJ8_XYLHT|nr:hypothetical protein L228DRAFT_240036 [Xylona heveae TC161]KZF21159.1 hypothetical protein L228DRAFT_240036 [Xylona heveae TC161]
MNEQGIPEVLRWILLCVGRDSPRNTSSHSDLRSPQAPRDSHPGRPEFQACTRNTIPADDMTRIIGGGSGAQGGTSSSSTPRYPFDTPYATLPSNAPDILVKNTIYVRDRRRLWGVQQEERNTRFHLLVRRYINQLLYGCQNPACTTPTCLSCRRRITEAPLRKLTPVSARTVACYLATQEDPEKDLCPHQPVIPPDFETTLSLDQNHQSNIEREGKPARHVKHGSRHKSWSSSAKQNHSSETPAFRQESLPQKPRDASFARQNEAESESAEQEDRKQKKEQKKKDPKSFTQNLFDTISMKMLEWLPLPTSTATLNFLPEGKEDQESSALSMLASPGPVGQDESYAVSGAPATLHTSVQANPAAPDDDGDEDGEESHVGYGRPNLQRNGHSERNAADATRLAEGHRPRSCSLHIEKRQQPVLQVQKPRLSHQSHTKASRIPPPNTPMGRTLDPTYFPSTQSPEQARHREKRRHDAKSAKREHHSHRIKESRNENKTPRLPRETPSRSNGKARAKETSLIDTPHGIDQLGPIDTFQTKLFNPPQSLSHLSYEIAMALLQLEDSADPISTEEREFLRSINLNLPRGKRSLRRALSLRDLETRAFLAQSIYYVFSSPEAMTLSFRDEIEHDQISSSTISKGSQTRDIDTAMRMLMRRNDSMLFISLWQGYESLFVSPTELTPLRSPRIKSTAQPSSLPEGGLDGPGESAENHILEPKFIVESDAAHLFIIGLHALAAAVPKGSLESWVAIRRLRAHGKVVPDVNLLAADSALVNPMLQGIDVLEDDLALRFVGRFLRAVAARVCFSRISEAKGDNDMGRVTSEKRLFDIILDHLEQTVKGDHETGSKVVTKTIAEPGWSVPAAALEWFRSALLKEWDGKGEIKRWGVVGGALEFLSYLYNNRKRFSLTPEMFHTPFLADRLDPMEVPVEWLSSSRNPKTVHILSYPFLFPPSSLVSYFRAINYSNMSKAFEASVTMTRLVLQMSFAEPLGSREDQRLYNRLRTAMSTYLVLEVRRDEVLLDALNQLWRREKRELMRPLKVRMGMGEGEEGVDHGGVQQEFFRLVISEALNSDYGTFTVDSRTRMTWFRPCSLEPLYKFELLGLLFSIAIYNGLTLPITFPKALYRKLLGQQSTKIEHIQDGWPELAKGLTELLEWNEGDVGDIFMRTYDFSFDAFGKVMNVDMLKFDRNSEWPPTNSPSKKGKKRATNFEPDHSRTEGAVLDKLVSHEPSEDEAELVTNSNREQFVKDYIFWLTDKSIRPQYEAFARGFFVCLDRKAISMFSPEAFQSIVEGVQGIDIDALERTARYEDGYSSGHPLIQQFWQIVRQFSPVEKRHLLEFVTASDRVPVNGVESILFVIQRNGPDSDRVPTSLTCFGRLLLPEYSSKAKLEEKLRLALENGKGFGVP